MGEEDDRIELPPGFRFHPTDEELITHYLQRKVMDSTFSAKAIGEVDLNKSEPWDLPWKAKMGEKEWYFFCLKDRKYPSGLKTNRATDAGYWKATGKDREIYRGKSLVGMKKTLVFYRGRAPKGEKTNWVMHEYRLESRVSEHNLLKTVKSEWAISRVFEKSSDGKKIHFGSPLPPLMESSSSSSLTANNKTLSGSAYVPCFSNPIVNNNVVSTMNLFGSIYGSQTMALTQNLGMQNQNNSVLRALLGSNLKNEREITNNNNNIAEISSVLSGFESGRRAFHHQHDPSNAGAGPADLDFIWNY